MCLCFTVCSQTPATNYKYPALKFFTISICSHFVMFDLFCNEIKGEEVNPTEVEVAPTICEQIWYGLGQVGDFLFKNSYILNNIIMMVLKTNAYWFLL